MALGIFQEKKNNLVLFSCFTLRTNQDLKGSVGYSQIGLYKICLFLETQKLYYLINEI